MQSLVDAASPWRTEGFKGSGGKKQSCDEGCVEGEGEGRAAPPPPSTRQSIAAPQPSFIDSLPPLDILPTSPPLSLMLQLTAGPQANMAGSNYRPPCAEDCLSDDGENPNANNGISIESFVETSPGRANVRTKRSNPEHLGTEKDPTDKVPAFDVKSDSGYSSQSVAGMSSADSAASATSSQRSPPVVPAASSATPQQRAPRPSHQRRESTQSTQSSQPAARQPLSRRDSQASRRPTNERRSTITREQAPAPKRRDSRNVEECPPGCKCGADASEQPSRPRASRRLSVLQQPAESAPDISNRYNYDTRSQVSDPAHYYPSSSVDVRPTRAYHAQGGPVIQPAASRRLSVNQRPRPTSYQGDPNHNWQQPGMHPAHNNSPHDHGPPPSRSAYPNMHYPQPQMNSPYIPQYQPQQQAAPPAAFLQAQAMQPMRDQQRPHLPARAQTSAYGYPVPSQVMQVERSDRKMPSARYHSNAPPPPLAQRRPLEYRHQNADVSESESDSETESEEGDYESEYRQPSRNQKGPSRRRPSLHHANTTPAPPPPEIRRPQTIVIPEQRDHRIRDRNLDARPSRRASISRPPAIKSESAYDTPRARVIVEGSRTFRRESLQAYDQTFKEHQRRTRQQEYNEQPQTKRSSRVYESIAGGHDYERDYHDEDEEPEPIPRALRRRRDTDAEPRRKPRQPVEVRQVANAEDYINSRRGELDTLADQSYAIAKKRSSRASGGPSEAESSRSRGSDDNGEIRLRIGNDAPVTLSLNGDMAGRTLQLVPIENGMNELVISSNGRGGESSYRSERGSVRAAAGDKGPEASKTNRDMSFGGHVGKIAASNRSTVAETSRSSHV
ncbi:hypothetical protein E8E12_001757 [Didymella heteroderae]|uniref:Uncharacterized protein n=1 Tax=Didymella heteroderae TaxID=1769908 RepID=A0A9P4WIM4_9PLEO|nr:hypothetical protein E8E12_001757 [Didymella heteroderae]